MNTSPSSPALSTLVLVDPTFPDGSSSLSLIDDDEDLVLIVVLISGRCSHALHDRARRTGRGVMTAAWSHLESLALRVSRPGRVVGTIVAGGPDPAVELSAIAAEHAARRVIVPTSSVEFDPGLVRRISRQTRLTVVYPEPAPV